MATRLTTLIVLAIVTATLIAGLIVGAQRDDSSGPIDLIILNGKVYPADGTGRFAEAVAVRGNQILRVGTNREIKRLRRRQTRIIDAHGGSVLPAFNDSHVHFLSGGLALAELDVSDALTFEEVGEKIRAYAAAHPDRPWIQGRGWRDAAFPGGLPTRQQLDLLVPDRPVYLMCRDGHAGWANSKALALAGIVKRTPNPANGIVVKDPKTGEPTGVLKEAAQALMVAALPLATRDDQFRAISTAIAEAHRLGVTSIQHTSGTPGEFELYDEIRRAGELKVRMYSAVSVEPGLTAGDAAALDAIFKKYPDDPLFKAGGVNIVLNGSAQPSAPAMRAADANRATTGRASYSSGELARLVTLMDARGWQILIDAPDAAAVRMALDAYERAVATNPLPPRGRRHRIEHAATIHAADLRRFGALGVIASQHLFPAGSDALDVGYLATDRSPSRWTWKSITDAGGRLAFGSDWPATPLDPLVGINAALSHTFEEPTPAGDALPEQKVSLPAIIDAYTSGAAYASFDEQRKGTLARGMLADIVILSGDIFATAPDGILDAAVEMTIFDGQVVYVRDKALTEDQ